MGMQAIARTLPATSQTPLENISGGSAGLIVAIVATSIFTLVIVGAVLGGKKFMKDRNFRSQIGSLSFGQLGENDLTNVGPGGDNLASNNPMHSDERPLSQPDEGYELELDEAGLEQTPSN